MILDRLSRIDHYMGLNKHLDRAIAMLKSGEMDTMTVGKHVIEEDQLFYLIQSYATKDPSEAKLEGHKRFIDLQFMVSGEEAMDVADVADVTLSVPYDADTDIQFFDGEYNRVVVKEGAFAIFFPHDAHRPGIRIGEAKNVRKVVFKIAY